jgi:hypothetical protein
MSWTVRGLNTGVDKNFHNIPHVSEVHPASFALNSWSPARGLSDQGVDLTTSPTSVEAKDGVKQGRI